MASEENSLDKYKGNEVLVRQKLGEFKNSLPVNRFELHIEVAGQAALYKDIGELFVYLKHAARIAKDHLDYVKAKVKHDIRENPGKYGVSKLSNDAVDEACLLAEEYRKALSDYSDAQYKADAAVVLLESAAQRKSSLRDAVSLYVHEYYNQDQDMPTERKALAEISENGVTSHRRRLAQQRTVDIQEENVNEQEGN